MVLDAEMQSPPPAGRSVLSAASCMVGTVRANADTKTKSQHPVGTTMQAVRSECSVKARCRNVILCFYSIFVAAVEQHAHAVFPQKENTK